VLEELATELAGTHPIVLDPNCRPFVITDYPAYRARMLRLFAVADLVKLSSDDARYLFPDGGFAEAIQGILGRGGIVLHTDGPGPIDVYAPDGKASVMPLTGDIVDTVGAGDIFGATVLWALSRQGWVKGQRLGLAQVLPAAQTAAVAAYLGCQRAGAEPPSLAELTDRLQGR